jgi:hypothetical protein
LLERILQLSLENCSLGDLISVVSESGTALGILGGEEGGAFDAILLEPLSSFLPEAFTILEFTGSETVLKICSEYTFLPNSEPLSDEIQLGYRPNVGDLLFDAEGMHIVGMSTGHLRGVRQFSPSSGRVSRASGGIARIRSWRIVSCEDTELELFSHTSEAATLA